jgi:hypothetical protein
MSDLIIMLREKIEAGKLGFPNDEINFIFKYFMFSISVSPLCSNDTVEFCVKLYLIKHSYCSTVVKVCQVCNEF